MKSIIAFILLGTSILATAAQEPCRVEPLSKEGAEQLSWTGPCKDGLAEGKGVIEARGEDWKGWRYEGQVQRGRPHGHGYMKMEDGREYEGEYADGQLEGMGIYLSPFGDRYDGNFKAGRRDGRGSMSFALGGRYDGDWKNDQFNGHGIAEYPGGRKLDTIFVDGLPRGQAAKALAQESYKLTAAEADLGSNLKRAVSYNSDIPLNKSYADMTEGQRNSVRARYRLMDEGDEPPFPINGMEKLQRALIEVNRKTYSAGELRMIVKIDSAGQASSVSILAAPDPAMGQYAARLFMVENYKPALCAGKPCAMAFPVRMMFIRRG